MTIKSIALKVLKHIRIYAFLFYNECFYDVSALVFLLKFRQEYLDTLYRYAKFQYECGNYSGAAEYLYFFRVLVSCLFLSFSFFLKRCLLSTTLSDCLWCLTMVSINSLQENLSYIKIECYVMFARLF